MRRHLIEHPAPSASPGPATLPRQAGATEIIAALTAGFLPGDQRELVRAHVAHHAGGGGVFCC